MELPSNDPTVANASNTPTLAGSTAPSRVNSAAKKGSRPPSRSDSIRLSADNNSDVVPVKDRAPPFVVALCLFQSLAGLLFGYVRLSTDCLFFFGLLDSTADQVPFVFYSWEQGVIAGLVQNGDCEYCGGNMTRAEELTFFFSVLCVILPRRSSIRRT